MTRDLQTPAHPLTWLTGDGKCSEVEARHRADEIRAFCRAARTRADGASPAAEELEWLQWSEAYADRIGHCARRWELRRAPSQP
ncbi:hypothetical protein ACQ4WX_37525 [Streptomyces lasalocidi]